MDKAIAFWGKNTRLLMFLLAFSITAVPGGDKWERASEGQPDDILVDIGKNLFTFMIAWIFMKTHE